MKSVNQENDGHQEEQIYRRTHHWLSEAGRGSEPEPLHLGMASLHRLDLRGGVCRAVRRRAGGGVDLRVGGPPGQVPADGLGDDDAAAVRDARAGGVPDGREGEGGGSVTWARRSFSKWQRRCC